MNLSPLDSFNSERLIVMSHASLETEKQLDMIEKEAFEEGSHLPMHKQDLYKAMVRQSVNQIRMQIAEMRSKGKTEYEITRAVRVLVQDFKASNESFLDKNRLYSDAKTDVRSNFHQTSDSLHSLNSNFGKIKRLDFEMEEIEATLEASTQRKKILNIQEIAEKKIKEKAVKQAAKVVSKEYGKTCSVAFKVGAKIVTNSVDGESENPKRDLVISAGSTVAVGEGLVFALKQIPYAKVITVPLALHDLAVLGEDSINQLNQNEEIKECWNQHAFMDDIPQFETSCTLAKGMMQACQTPGQCVKSISDYVSEQVTNVADNLGINEKNILSTLEQMGKYNPYEDTDWKY